MVDFGDTQLEQVTPRGGEYGGVSDRSGSILVKNLAQTADFITEGLTSMAESRSRRKNDAVLEGFLQENLRLAEAVDQGVISSQEARMRSRAIVSRTIANNPSIAGDVLQAQGKVMSTAGLGKVVDEGTKEEQRKNAQIDAAWSAGFITDGGSSEEGLYQYLQYTQAQRELKAQKDALELVSKKQSVRTGEIDLVYKEAQLKTRQALASGGSAYNWKFNNDIKDIQSRLSANQITPEQAVQELDGKWGVVQATINALGADAGGEYVSNLTSPMQFSYQVARDAFTGKTSLDVMNNTIEKSIALSKQNLIGDPKVAKAIALSEMLRNLGPGAIGHFNKMAIDILSDNSVETGRPGDTTYTDSEKRQATQSYFKGVKDNIKSIDSTTGDKVKLKTEISTNVNNIVKGVNVYQSAVENPTEYNETVDFLASPEMGQYVNSGLGFDKDAGEKAKQVLQQQYGDVVLPLIEKSYQDATALVGTRRVGNDSPAMTVDSAEVESLIEPVFQGSGITFRLREGASDQGTANGHIRQLNKEVAPTLNRLIRMTAHLSGDTNYKAAYEAHYASLFQVNNIEQATQLKNAISNLKEGYDNIEDYEPEGVLENGDVVAKGKERLVADPQYASWVNANIKEDVKTAWANTQAAFGQELTITSGFRTKKHNSKVGGAKGSQHLHGNAIDVDVSGLSRQEQINLIKTAYKAGFRGIGVYNNGSLHFDIAGKRAWGPTYKNSSTPTWVRSALEELGYSFK